jgi:hypothetical protein
VTEDDESSSLALTGDEYKRTARKQPTTTVTCLNDSSCGTGTTAFHCRWLAVRLFFFAWLHEILKEF